MTLEVRKKEWISVFTTLYPLYADSFGCSMNRSYAQLPMNRPLPDFCAFKLLLIVTFT